MQGPTEAGLKAAAAYSAENKGHAVLVMHKGKIIFETAQNGWDLNRGHVLASGTKSFVGVLAIMAQEDGLMSLDEPMANTLTEWKSDPQKSKITPRLLLSLSSGLEGGSNGRVPSYADAINGQMKAAPGQRFQYGPIPYQTFGEFLKRKLKPSGRTVGQYLQTRLLDPIGIKPSFWRSLPTGEPHFPSGAFLTPREWVKFGEFVLNDGRVGDKQVVKSGALSALFRPSPANKRYGMTWWLNSDQDGDESDTKFVMAAGAGKQRLYILEQHDMIVVRFGEESRFQDSVFIEKLLATR